MAIKDGGIHEVRSTENMLLQKLDVPTVICHAYLRTRRSVDIKFIDRLVSFRLTSNGKDEKTWKIKRLFISVEVSKETQYDFGIVFCKSETMVAPGTGNIVKLTRVDDVINESIAEAGVNAGNITSKFGVTADEALTLGDKLLGQGYKEVGKAGSGVSEKQVGNQTYRFRIDNSSLAGNHKPNVPHVHVEILDEARNILVNNHIPLIE